MKNEFRIKDKVNVIWSFGIATKGMVVAVTAGAITVLWDDSGEEDIFYIVNESWMTEEGPTNVVIEKI